MGGRDLTPLDLSDPEHPLALWEEQREVKKFPTDCAGGGGIILEVLEVFLRVKNSSDNKVAGLRAV